MSLAGQFPSLANDEVHVWRCSLDDDAAGFDHRLACLSREEQERAARFKLDRPRCQFVMARSALRSLIGAYLEIDPVDVRFRTSEHGKLHLFNSPGQLEFNLSHSHDLALFAFSRQAPVGIDVEWLGREVATAEIAGRYFSRLEQDQLNDLPAEERPRGFMECWTRKEAYLKARGSGLSREPRTFSVSLAPTGNASLLEDQIEPSAAHQWRVYPLELTNDYCGALATAVVPGGVKVICHW